MTQYVEGATVYHTIRRLDLRTGEAVTDCGREGEAVEADPDREELCGDCLGHGKGGQRPHPDDLDDEEDEDENADA